MKKSLLTLALLAIIPVTSQAAAPSYTYVDASFVRLNAESSGGSDENTFAIAGSAMLGDSNFFIKARHQFTSDIPHYTHTHSDHSENYFDLGYRWSLSDNTSMHATVGTGSDTWNDGSYQIGLGVRHALAGNFEVGAELTHREFNYSDYPSAFFVAVSGQYNFNDNWAVNLTYTDGDFDGGSESNWDATYDSTYALGLRYNF